MKIVADENMPFVAELFSPYADVSLLSGREITAQDLIGTDVLLVRSVTAVDARLLDGSSVRFVGTATIGTDHVDKPYLQRRGIEFASAPGCNANAVVQYVLSAFSALQQNWHQLKVGIIGCGNVGGLLYHQLKRLGVNCCCFDPFISPAQITDLVPLEEVLRCDAVCLHTPLTVDGDHPTFHLLNEQMLSRLKPGAILLNAGRGAVIDNQALLKLLPYHALRVVLDVWESEPEISLALLNAVDLATPHIAGHSVNGKVKGTLMLRDAFCRWSGQSIQKFDSPEIVRKVKASSLGEAILGSYDIRADDKRMRQALLAVGVEVGAAFDQLRKNYPERWEFQNFSISPEGKAELWNKLAVLGFAQTG